MTLNDEQEKGFLEEGIIVEAENIFRRTDIKEVDLAMVRRFVGRSLDAKKSEDFILGEIMLAATQQMLRRQYFSDLAQDHLLPVFGRK